MFEPYVCAVLSKGDDPAGWIDCGNLNSRLPDPRVYVSHGGVRTLMKECGFPAPERAAELEQQVAELQDDKRRLEAENANLRERFDAIDVLASADFRARKKPGKRKETAHA